MIELLEDVLKERIRHYTITHEGVNEADLCCRPILPRDICKQDWTWQVGRQTITIPDNRNLGVISIFSPNNLVAVTFYQLIPHSHDDGVSSVTPVALLVTGECTGVQIPFYLAMSNLADWICDVTLLDPSSKPVFALSGYCIEPYGKTINKATRRTD